MTFRESAHPRVASGQFTSKSTSAPSAALGASVGPAVRQFDSHTRNYDFDLAEKAAPAALSERARELVPDAEFVDFEMTYTDDGRYLSVTGVTGDSGTITFNEEPDQDDEPLQRVPFLVSGSAEGRYVDGTNLPGMAHSGGDEYRFAVSPARGSAHE